MKHLLEQREMQDVPLAVPPEARRPRRAPALTTGRPDVRPDTRPDTHGLRHSESGHVTDRSHGSGIPVDLRIPGSARTKAVCSASPGIHASLRDRSQPLSSDLPAAPGLHAGTPLPSRVRPLGRTFWERCGVDWSSGEGSAREPPGSRGGNAERSSGSHRGGRVRGDQSSTGDQQSSGRRPPVHRPRRSFRLRQRVRRVVRSPRNCLGLAAFQRRRWIPCYSWRHVICCRSLLSQVQRALEPGCEMQETGSGCGGH